MVSPPLLCAPMPEAAQFSSSYNEYRKTLIQLLSHDTYIPGTGGLFKSSLLI